MIGILSLVRDAFSYPLIVCPLRGGTFVSSIICFISYSSFFLFGFAVAQLTTKIKHLSSVLHKKVNLFKISGLSLSLCLLPVFFVKKMQVVSPSWLFPRNDVTALIVVTTSVSNF